MTAEEFEGFTYGLFQQTEPAVNDLTITLHESIAGVDGVYDFDATVRYRVGDMAFLIVVEAKRHTYPIKREVVQVLHTKAQSVGAHKAVLVSTASFQRGALKFALVHGIALVKVTEGRFTYEVRGELPQPTLSREEASVHLGLPTFVAHCFSPPRGEGSYRCTLISGRPDLAAGLLLTTDANT